MKLFCPSCGNAIEFRYDDSFVRVCDACHSALLRTDRGIDTLGQLADLAPSSTGLQLGDRGRWQGVDFELVGRTQYRHAAGGSWDEWYLHFEDGRWGWLSEAEGRWTLSFAASSGSLPALSELPLGAPVQLSRGGSVSFTVAERGQATLLSAAGELPFAARIGGISRFVDLSAPEQRFATLDYGAPDDDRPPQLYVGSYVSLEQLGLKAREPGATAAPPLPAGSAERLACSNCGGSIELRLPGSSLSVVCPYCASVLDCEGPLRILERLQQRSQRKPPIPLGAQGELAGVRYTVTGRLVRAVTVAGQSYEWDEYLLHAPSAGYRWLVCSGGHYSFVSEVPAGAVRTRGEREVQYQGRTFQLFDSGEARVQQAYGEFYWRVRAGETVQSRDYVAPPLMLSRELSGDELHWSLGVYQSTEQVRSAFGLPTLPRPALEVGPHQPFPHRHWQRVAAVLLSALLVCAGILALLSEGKPVFSAQLALGSEQFPEAKETSAAAQHVYVYFSPSFELTRGQNLELRAQLPLSNSWAYVGVDLIHEASGELTTTGLELSHYSGVEEGEAWSEDETRAERLISVHNAGSHVLRIELQTPVTRGRLDLALRQDVFMFGALWAALLALALPAGVLLLLQYGFERKRWSNSDFAPLAYATGAEDDDD